MLNLKIIIGSTRPGRAADRVAAWLSQAELTKLRADPFYYYLVARTKYREQGEFLVFLYFNEAAVQICKDAGIPLRIVDRVDFNELPSNKETVLERSYLAPVSG